MAHILEEPWRLRPSSQDDLETLARELVRRKGLENQEELEQFLSFGDHPEPASLSDELFAKERSESETFRKSFNDGIEDSPEPTRTDLIRSLSKKQYARSRSGRPPSAPRRATRSAR